MMNRRTLFAALLGLLPATVTRKTNPPSSTGKILTVPYADLETLPPGLYIVIDRATRRTERIFNGISGRFFWGSTTGRVFARIRHTSDLPMAPLPAHMRWNRRDGKAVYLQEEWV